MLRKWAWRHDARLVIPLQVRQAMALQRWSIDRAHSRIGFHVRHLMITNVRGWFDTWDGVLELDPDQPTQSVVRVKIDASSIDTREPRRDTHLRIRGITRRVPGTSCSRPAA